MTERTPLSTNSRDVAAAVARGALGGIPVVGSAIAETVSTFIPGQKLERVVSFVEELAERIRLIGESQAVLEDRLRTPEGSDLLEEGIVQASRAISKDRRRRIANVVLSGIVERDLKYDRTKKLLDILSSLTDSELLLLTYYSEVPTFGSKRHTELQREHPELLRPVSREIGAPDSEVARGAFRDNYEATLVSHGLLERAQHGLRLTALGRILLNAAGDGKAEGDAPAS